MNKLENQSLKGYVKLVLKNADGSVVQTWEGNNLIPNVGKAAFAGLISGVGSVPIFNYLAVGTSGTAAASTDTALGAEISTNGLARHSATMSLTTTTNTNDTLLSSYTWTASGSSTVAEIGTFNASSAGTIGGHYIPGSPISIVASQQLAATYSIQLV